MLVVRNSDFEDYSVPISFIRKQLEDRAGHPIPMDTLLGYISVMESLDILSMNGHMIVLADKGKVMVTDAVNSKGRGTMKTMLSTTTNDPLNRGLVGYTAKEFLSKVIVCV